MTTEKGDGRQAGRTGPDRNTYAAAGGARAHEDAARRSAPGARPAGAAAPRSLLEPRELARVDRVTALVAERLSDPARVAGIAERAGGGPETGYAAWHPVSGASGHPGIALLFAALGDREGAHRHLTAAASGLRTRPPLPAGAMTGLPALAFAARVAAGRGGAYAALLSSADRSLTALTERLLARAADARGSAAGVPMAVYDAASGLSGLGRHLLGAGHHEPLTRRVLEALVGLASPTVVSGRTVPGFVTGDPLRVQDAGSRRGRGVNLGMAHGIPGPLALLSTAWLQGVRVAGQREAIESIAEWLVSVCEHDTHGLYWPQAVALDGPAGRPPPARAAWCYGAPGAGTALHLAGRALSVARWRATAAHAMAAALSRPRQIRDASLCHGAAGLLCLVAAMCAEAEGEQLRRHIPELVGDLLDRADPERPFLFSALPPSTHHEPDVPLDRPGLLDGAAGAALALSALSGLPADGRGGLPWQAVLLTA
ncbi:lanthionine synthetase C family protein [Streptomyces sp. 8L]|uniref:lanthionine synthetase C family protein n=1 Tax=Streptomyces sp. 8L TaxID=2877242 RepID=UPI001CD593A9|nr:lanthionine synthetase C family protein [Streptomyces sp. 8L]MCA1218972.1 lanthionine synthetase C family protein [Streptomyces sp. 8L]